jgi:hypothetical protein
MSTPLAKKPATVMRTYTQQVRDHVSAMARVTDQYFAALKRAEADYFDGVKRITEAMARAATESTTIVTPAPTAADAQAVISPPGE